MADYTFDPTIRRITLGPTSIDENQGPSDSFLTLDNTYTAVAQSFKTTNSVKLGVVSAPIYKVGNPVGDGVAKLYTHTGTYGSGGLPGTLLATSDPFHVAQLETVEPDALVWPSVDFPFPHWPTLTAATEYFLVFEFSGGDASNYLKIPSVTGGSGHAGNAARFDGSWAALTDDLLFDASIPIEILDVKDMYSRWKEWAKDTDDAKNAIAFLSVGGNTVDEEAGTEIPAYIYITNGWQIKPKEGGHTLNVTNGILLREGGGDPFVSTVGEYAIRINYQQPVQAITVPGLILDEFVETSYTMKHAIRLMLAAMSGKLSGAPGGPILIRDINDTKDRITATVDANGNRTAVTTDVSD